MSLWVVVGGQYGSEGKGKISAFITLREDIDICIRCGGPNSGHSFVAEDGSTKLVRQLPTGFVNPRTKLMIPAGALIDLDVLRYEIESLGLDERRVRIDRNAMVIEPSDRERERKLGLHERLSSTLCGVGSAVSRRALRGDDVRLAHVAAERTPWLERCLDDVSARANQAIDDGQRVLVEGTQGFGLSLYHTRHYPKATSRDTTAAGFLSEVGLSPRLATEIVVVLRTFPIRVSGDQAGPMFEEIDWETIRRESGSPTDVSEFTTVTRRLRRVGRFDFDLARRAVAVNRPTRIALNFLDYICFRDREGRDFEGLSDRALAAIAGVEERLGQSVRYAGVGPGLDQTFELPMLAHAGTAEVGKHGSTRNA